tara:strand:+ start:2028 stop:2222 length:195 start_codon:yes stop_codon:yes gene_type:complete
MFQSGEGVSNEFSILDQLFGDKHSQWTGTDIGFKPRKQNLQGYVDKGFMPSQQNRWGHLPPGAL